MILIRDAPGLVEAEEAMVSKSAGERKRSELEGLDSRSESNEKGGDETGAGGAGWRGW